MYLKFPFKYFIFLVVFPITLFSQSLVGNERIKYNQDYLKVSIDTKGVYRINKNDFISNGFNILNLNPKNIQVFFRGKEIAIYIYGEEDNSFDENDYIEFYAINNDGKQDEEVYKPRNSRPHPYSSLYTDETAYFITFSNSIGKRMLKPQQFKSNLPIDPYYIANQLKVFNEQWNMEVGNGFPASELVHSYFEPFEALVSKTYRLDKEGSEKVFIENILLDEYEDKALASDQIGLETMIFSRKSSSKVINWTFGSQSGKLNLFGYNYQKAKSNIFKHNSSSLDLKIEIESSNDGSIPQNDRFSIGYYLIKYPRKFLFKDNSEYTLLDNIQNQSKIKFTDLSQAPIGYDITNFENQKLIKIEANDIAKEVTISIDSTLNKRTIWLCKLPKIPKKFELIDFKRNAKLNYNYLIITDNKLAESAKQYSDYRGSPNGGNFTPLVKYTKDIYNEYMYGERNPMAINRFISNIRNNDSLIKYIFLIGKGYSFPVGLKIRENLDLVPTIGFPASDNLLSVGINETNLSIPTGRISALTNEEVVNYLDKVKEFEAEESNNSKSGFWKKSVLHLSGGADPNQINQFKALMDNLGYILEKSQFGGKYSMISKSSATQSVQNVDITEKVNNGVSFITFVGHSSANTLDLNIGYASDSKLNYNNKSLYPFLFFNGCSAAGIFANAQPLTSDWISTKNKGAIGVLAQSYYSFISSNETYMKKFYNLLFNDKTYLNLPIGDVIKAVGDDILKNNSSDPYLLGNIDQLILQGDPSIQIFKLAKPDFQIADEQLFLITTQKNKVIAESDSLNLGIIISNYGINEQNKTVNLKLKSTYLDGSSTDKIITIKAISYQDTVFMKLKKDLKLRFVTATIDNDNNFNESNEDNNFGTINLNWDLLRTLEYYSSATVIDKSNPNLTVKLNGSLPINGMQVTPKPILEVSLIDENSLGNKIGKLEIYYKKICDTCSNTLQKLELGSLSGNPNEIVSKIELKDFIVGEYVFFIQGYDAKRNASGDVYILNFKIVKDSTAISLRVFPNPMSLYTNFQFNILSDELASIPITIAIYNQQGINLKSISANLNSSSNNIYWDLTDFNGNLVVPGQYFYSVISDEIGFQLKKNGKIIVQ